MLFISYPLIYTLPILRFEFYKHESSFLVLTSVFDKILIIFKNHFNYQFKVLTCISGVDYPENLYRFKIVYELLSIKFNLRLRLKILIDELTPVNSIETIFPGASWWESEIWDMFGIFFLNQYNLTRLLTDYGFQGYPLRKDFPLSGFTESKYNSVKNRVVYENIELAQEYRTFEFLSPWEK
uniref:NADH dehydrogenase subunit 9 n=1 Tax=Amicula sp. isolate GU52X-4 cfCalB7 TaxID=3003489 RepID=A0A9E8YZI5_9STRA|nr:NADH dehydrogenase subunit 9 [Amicula sp. isolate GU52X-4 cfCalB7]